jgi:hypothetical protein
MIRPPPRRKHTNLIPGEGQAPKFIVKYVKYKLCADMSKLLTADEKKLKDRVERKLKM